MGIALKQLSYTYQEGTPFEGAALFDVNIEIPSGSYTALIGHTGSGKSTILQLLNGLLLPSRGEVQMNDLHIDSESSQRIFEKKWVSSFNFQKVNSLLRLL